MKQVKQQPKQETHIFLKRFWGGLLLLFILFGCLIAALFLVKKKCIDKQNKPQIEQCDPQSFEYHCPNWLDTALCHIKRYEGFRATPYYDNDSSLTIGYGHHIRKGESFSYITRTQGDSLLRKDFDLIKRRVDQKYQLNDTQTIAVSLFSYNIGLTKFHNSTLRQLIEQGYDVSSEWVKWKHAQINGEKRELYRLKQRRQFELSIFNQ